MQAVKPGDELLDKPNDEENSKNEQVWSVLAFHVAIILKDGKAGIKYFVNPKIMSLHTKESDM